VAVAVAVRMEGKDGEVPRLATAAVLEVKCEPMPAGSQAIKGYDFNEGVDYERLLDTYKHIGFQAANYGLAVEEINRMISWRLSDEPVETETDESMTDPEVRKNTKCTIWLSYTSNMISCGVREVIRYLVEHKMVRALLRIPLLCAEHIPPSSRCRWTCCALRRVALKRTL
jgi:deoxyhypusine synthase